MAMGNARPIATCAVAMECLPRSVVESGKYSVRCATDPAELGAVQRLRFEVFNLELGEGLEESHAEGRDRDRFDSACHHLMVIDDSTREVVGAYLVSLDVGDLDPATRNTFCK